MSGLPFFDGICRIILTGLQDEQDLHDNSEHHVRSHLMTVILVTGCNSQAVARQFSGFCGAVFSDSSA